MSVPRGKTSPLMLAAAWIVVGIPLAWGIYQTAIKALPLFVAPAPQAQVRPVHGTESKNRPSTGRDGLANGVGTT